MSVGKMRIYACGGAGINIAHFFNKMEAAPLSAEVDVTYVDTSRSNLKPDIDPKQTYILDADGSGKVRSENYDKAIDIVKQILLDHKPHDFNVVVFSGSGGSGGVLGPLIIRELISRGLASVAIVVGSDESGIAASNTLKTLKTLEAYSRKIEQPIVMHYRHNRRRKPRTEVDSELHLIISYLAVLSSRQIGEVDGRDVTNLFFYQKVSSVEPRLAALEVIQNNDTIYEDSRPHTILSIYNTPDAETLEYVPEYHCAGYAKLPWEGVESLHYMVDVEVIQSYVKNLTKTINELEEVQQSRVRHDSIVSKDEADDEGTVL